jgi:hypothetical protein
LKINLILVRIFKQQIFKLLQIILEIKRNWVFNLLILFIIFRIFHSLWIVKHILIEFLSKN